MKLVESAVVEVLSDIVGRSISEPDLDADLTTGLKIISDDLSMRFVPELEAKLGVEASASQWSNVNTGRDAIRLFESLLAKRDGHS